jgi:hypothetical protein
MQKQSLHFSHSHTGALIIAAATVIPAYAHHGLGRQRRERHDPHGRC